jgi:hypothetical protein
MRSSALESGEVRLSQYEYVVIYEAEKASFIELQLEQLMEDQGFKVVGQNDAQTMSDAKILGTRYTEEPIVNGYGNRIGTILTVLLEDFVTDRTLLTARGQVRMGPPEEAWNKVSSQLRAEIKTQ